MSYRIDNKPPVKHKHRGVAAMTSLSVVDIVNGQYAKMAYPLWYIETNLPKKIYPRVPDRKELIKLWERCIYWDIEHRWCCHPTWHHCHHEHCLHCKHYLDMDRVIPIHIKEEYSNVYGEVHFEKKDDGTFVIPGLSAEVLIEEPRDDYIVRVLFNAQCYSAQTEKQECKFSVVLKNDNENDKMSSVIINGKVRVWPGIL